MLISSTTSATCACRHILTRKKADKVRRIRGDSTNRFDDIAKYQSIGVGRKLDKVHKDVDYRAGAGGNGRVGLVTTGNAVRKENDVGQLMAMIACIRRLKTCKRQGYIICYICSCGFKSGRLKKVEKDETRGKWAWKRVVPIPA